MEFTLEELEIIWASIENDLIGDSAQKILDKISTKYSHCPICHKLFLKEDFQAHYDSEFED